MKCPVVALKVFCSCIKICNQLISGKMVLVMKWASRAKRGFRTREKKLPIDTASTRPMSQTAHCPPSPTRGPPPGDKAVITEPCLVSITTMTNNHKLSGLRPCPLATSESVARSPGSSAGFAQSLTGQNQGVLGQIWGSGEESPAKFIQV